MKKRLLFLLLPIFQLWSSQIYFQPQLNHGYEPYTATLSGNGTIYYTIDGTDPTINSPSGVNTVNINISEVVPVKAILKSSDNQISEIFSKIFYFGPFLAKTVYFKAPTTWSNVCSFSNSHDPETVLDIYSGFPMTPVCEGWYKSSLAFFVGDVVFDNCVYFALPYYQSYDIITEETVFYDYSIGPITNPPACLLATNDSSKKVALVKVFPNPVQDFITIESEKKFLSYEVFDASGKSLSANQLIENKINVSRLTPGNYFIKLNYFSNETILVKFIKK